jgi:hypothetical protein
MNSPKASLRRADACAYDRAAPRNQSPAWSEFADELGKSGGQDRSMSTIRISLCLVAVVLCIFSTALTTRTARAFQPRADAGTRHWLPDGGRVLEEVLPFFARRLAFD